MLWIIPENFSQNGPAIWEEFIHTRQDSPPLCKPLTEPSAMINIQRKLFRDHMSHPVVSGWRLVGAICHQSGQVNEFFHPHVAWVHYQRSNRYMALISNCCLASCFITFYYIGLINVKRE